MHCLRQCQNVTRCVQCRAAAYCSQECQKEDWHVHKHLCKSFSDFFQTRPVVRPEGIQKYALGILYPENERKPTLHWVPVEWISATENYPAFENYKREAFFGEGPISSNEIRVNPRTLHQLRSTLEVRFRDNFCSDGSASNQALARTVKGQLGQDWRGPLLVTRMVEGNIDGSFRDIDLQDFRDVTDYFVSYGSNPLGLHHLSEADLNTEMHTELEESAEVLRVKVKYRETGELIATAEMKVEGVKIQGTQKTPGASSYKAMSIRLDHEIFRPQNAQVSRSEIAARIGLPLLILRYPVMPDSLPTYNIAATWLHINTDDKSDGYGWAPAEWRMSVGTILVVREDKIRLTPRQMEIICAFCQHWMGPLFERSIEAEEEPDEPKSQKYVLDAMTPEKFEQFFIGYRTAKGWIDNIYEHDCRNPYTYLEY